MVHPRGEVLSFPPLRYLSGDFEKADLDQLVKLYRPLLPRATELENVALGGDLLYDSTARVSLPSRAPTGRPSGRAPPTLQVFEFYRGSLRAYRHRLRGSGYALELYAIGLDTLAGELEGPSPGLIGTKLALLAAPVLKMGRKKREFHRLQMAHRARLLAYGLRHLLPTDYRFLTPSGGALLLLDTLLLLDPSATAGVKAAFLSSSHAQRNRNALYRRVNWLLEKYDNYRRAGYKGGEPAYELVGHEFAPSPHRVWTARLKLVLHQLRATSNITLACDFAAGALGPLVGLTRPAASCQGLFDYTGDWLEPYRAGPCRAGLHHL